MRPAPAIHTGTCKYRQLPAGIPRPLTQLIDNLIATFDCLSSLETMAGRTTRSSASIERSHQDRNTARAARAQKGVLLYRIDWSEMHKILTQSVNDEFSTKTKVIVFSILSFKYAEHLFKKFEARDFEVPYTYANKTEEHRYTLHYHPALPALFDVLEDLNLHGKLVF